MFTVEFAREVGIPFDGGFSYEYTPGGGVKIIDIRDNDGNICRVSKSLFRQFCKYAHECLAGWQDMAEQRAYEVAYDL